MPRKGANMSPEAQERQRASISRWKTEHLENLSVCLRKGKRDAYKALAAGRGTSVSAMIQDYMDAECKKDGIELP